MSEQAKKFFDDCKPFPWEAIKHKATKPHETPAQREARIEAEHAAVHAARMAQLTGLVKP